MLTISGRRNARTTRLLDRTRVRSASGRLALPARLAVRHLIHDGGPI